MAGWGFSPPGPTGVGSVGEPQAAARTEAQMISAMDLSFILASSSGPVFFLLRSDRLVDDIANAAGILVDGPDQVGSR
jgi:hypothetical protein